MVPITREFQSESPLHPKAVELLGEVFSRGWADPSKIHAASREAGKLLQDAKETFATAFGVRSDEIFFLGEPSLGFHLGISGYLSNSATLYYSKTDRAPVHAIVHQREMLGSPNIHIQNPVGTAGDVLTFQPVNPETGITSKKPEDFLGKVFVDNTAYGIHSHLPHNWASAIWQSRSWHGPSGLGVLAIRNGGDWRNPLPHSDATKVPQAFSIPLALASAVAFENFTHDYLESHSSITALKARIEKYLHVEIGEVIVVGKDVETSPNLLSVIIAGIDSERLVNQLSERGICVDAGSACLSGGIQPSHVLAAMGLPVIGNMRITLHPGVDEGSVQNLLTNIKELVKIQREIN